MGYIKEPDGVDFYVSSKPLSEKEKSEISEVIAYYKLTGRKRKLASNRVKPKTQNSSNHEKA